MNTLTFCVQVDMVLIDTKHVAGNTGVFAFVLCLSYLNLQSTVIMQDVSVSIQGAGSGVFKPEAQRVSRTEFW